MRASLVGLVRDLGRDHPPILALVELSAASHAAVEAEKELGRDGERSVAFGIDRGAAIDAIEQQVGFVWTHRRYLRKSRRAICAPTRPRLAEETANGRARRWSRRCRTAD